MSTSLSNRSTRAWLCCVALLMTGDAMGYGGPMMSLPLTSPSVPPGYSTLTGLRLEVDARWFDDGGYRPIRLRVSRQAPAPVARRVTITLSMGPPSTRDSSEITVRREIVLPAGEEAVEATLLCPALRAWGLVWWSVEVDGRQDAALSVSRNNATMLTAMRQERFMRMVRPDLDAQEEPFGEDESAGADPFQGRRRGGRRGIWMSPVRIAPFEEWLALSAADIVTIEMKELRRLASDEPENLAAIRRWLLAGGMVWVERVGIQPEGYREVDRLLGLESWRFGATPDERDEEEPAPAATTAPAQGGDDANTAAPENGANSPTETEPQRVNATTPVEEAPGWGYAPTSRSTESEDANAPADDAPNAGGQETPLQLMPKNTRGWFAQRDAGFGRVLAYNRGATDLPLPVQFGGMGEVVAAWRQRAWSDRHGIEPGGSCAEFGNLLVPGVGVAPVNEFQVLITLFVLAIGPLNYWLLWRRQQLHYLVLTTPLYAAAATLGLIAYAAVADGFGVKARVRSVTFLDQESGEAASWGRVSHYAATLPDAPATFPADVAVYPIPPGWESSFTAESPDRTLDWADNSQRMTAGWFPPRTAVQHLVVSCRPTNARVRFRVRDDGLEAANQLGVDIDLLLSRDADGAWWSGADLAAGGAAVLEGRDHLRALQELRLLAVENQPTFPIGAGKAVEDTLEALGNRTDLRRLTKSIAAAQLANNLANQKLDALTGLDGSRGLDLPPKTYVAVTHETIETPLGWDEVQEIGSFHVLVGKW